MRLGVGRVMLPCMQRADTKPVCLTPHRHGANALSTRLPWPKPPSSEPAGDPIPRPTSTACTTRTGMESRKNKRTLAGRPTGGLASAESVEPRGQLLARPLTGVAQQPLTRPPGIQKGLDRVAGRGTWPPTALSRCCLQCPKGGRMSPDRPCLERR